MTKKRCLYISTFGLGDAPPSNASEVVFETLVLPVIQNEFPDVGLVNYRFELKHGSINEQMLDDILSADLVIADITELTRNGFYELGIRHAAQLPTVLMAQVGHPLPFDVQNFRFVVYQYDSTDDEVEQRTREALIDAINDALRTVPATPELSLPKKKTTSRETRHELAARIQESAEALQSLRINSAGEIVASLQKIAANLEAVEDEKTPSAMREAGEKVLKILAKAADQLASVRGSRIIVAGIISLVVGGSGYPALTVYGLTLAFWQGPEIFAKAIETLTKHKK